MTVMQILPALEGGGVERGTLEINEGLVARGHRSLVVSAGGRLVEELQRQGGEHLTLDLSRRWPGTLLKTRKLRKLMLDHGVDLVHARSRMPAWVTFLAWRGLPAATRPRLVTTVHGLNSVNFYSRVMTFGERVIAVSHCCRDYVLKNYPQTDPDKVTVIHRGVAAEQFPYGYQPSDAWQAAWRAEFPQLTDRFTVLLPGRLTRLKGHFDLLQVILQLKGRGIPAHGLIVGGAKRGRPAYLESLHEEVKRLELTGDITFAGHRSDIRDVMSVSGAVISATSQPPESFGRTVLEAVRLGRPTVGYDHGGVGEVLEQVYPEGRVSLEDVAAMATVLESIYRGELAPPAETSAFDLDAMIDQEIDLYETMVAENRA
ncbi:MAG: glycosyltransferase family 4 protein [Planctomycetes bacterium]|nr:glycosyltransferase family 4 protein [Planctomycetota bacterium]